MQPNRLSKADSKVLAQVFDPESGPACVEVLINRSLPKDGHITDPLVLSDLQAREMNAIGCIERYEKSRDQSPEGKIRAYQAALAILDRIIVEQPDYASARNNRAQLRRWRFGDRNMLCQPRSSKEDERVAAASTAITDLKKSIDLASPTQPTGAVSLSQGRLLAQAHTQLGALYYAAAKDLSELEDAKITDQSFDGWTKDDFEEEASKSFYLGGLYGNEVAKALAIHTNPQAKLCGSIVKEAMRKELAEAGMV